MELSDLVFDPLHFVIHIDHSAGAVQQFIADILITVHFFDILLVTQLDAPELPRKSIPLVRIWISARMGVFPLEKNTGISTIM